MKETGLSAAGAEEGDGRGCGESGWCCGGGNDR